jgi:drug/metabolite transporter (DMT)-like permease
MPGRSKNAFVYAGLVLAAIFWGANFHFAKLAVGSLNPIVAASYRFIIAALILVVLFLFSGPIDWTVLKKHFFIYALLAFFGVFGYNVLFFIGMKTTSTVTGALINATNPLMTVLISRLLLKTSIRPIQVFGILLSFAGILGIISKGDPAVVYNLNFVSGDILILIATMLFGFFNVLTRKYLSGISPLFTTTVITGLSACMFLILLLFQTNNVTLNEIPFGVWGAILGMAIFGSVMAYIFWNKGLNTIGANKTAAFTNLVPLSAAAISVFIGETIGLGQIIGGIFIISGVIISSSSKNIEKEAAK